MIKVENLNKIYSNGIIRKTIVHAVKNVSFQIKRGETLGLVGQSGCGKSTVAKIILRLIPINSGKIFYKEKDITAYSFQKMKELRTKMQIIFQHPYSALNPRHKLYDSIAEPIRIHRLLDREKEKEKVFKLLDLVGLHSEILSRYPHEVSGGQIQRAVVARALSLDPDFIILDEPTSMLDVSVQAQILNLLKSIQKQYNLTFLFISHDIEVVRAMSHIIAIMNNGEIIEMGKIDQVYEHPEKEYTRKLINTFIEF